MSVKRMRKGCTALGAALALGLVSAACSSSGAQTEAGDESAEREPTAAEKPGESVAGTIVHFTAGDVIVEAVIEEDTPTTRSFLSMLPMTLTFSDYGGKEKVATPTGEFDFTDAEGLDPEVGDLFSYMPWGNVGFFTNTEGSTFSNSLTKIGSTDDLDQIELLDGEEVAIDIAHPPKE